MTALSVPLLGEHVTRGQWLAVICGFVGGDHYCAPGAVSCSPRRCCCHWSRRCSSVSTNC
ncbi:hypothetical protein ACQXZG_11995 [Corynebacterium diphtheriae]